MNAYVQQNFKLKRVPYAKKGVPPEEREYYVVGFGSAVGTIKEIKDYLKNIGLLDFKLIIEDPVEGNSKIKVDHYDE